MPSTKNAIRVGIVIPIYPFVFSFFQPMVNYSRPLHETMKHMVDWSENILRYRNPPFTLPGVSYRKVVESTAVIYNHSPLYSPTLLRRLDHMVKLTPLLVPFRLSTLDTRVVMRQLSSSSRRRVCLLWPLALFCPDPPIVMSSVDWGCGLLSVLWAPASVRKSWVALTTSGRRVGKQALIMALPASILHQFCGIGRDPGRE